MNFSEQRLVEWTRQVEGFLVKRLGDMGLASDLAQDAALRLLQAVEDDEAPQDPRAWLFRCARNLAIDEVRRRLPTPLGLEVQSLASDPDMFADQEPIWTIGNSETTRSELLGLLPAAMSKLPEHLQRLLRAHYHEGKDCETMADQERITHANTKVRLFRARQHLQRLLGNAVDQIQKSNRE